jgi:N-acetylmuramic acid 6-phosphate etherase
LNTEDVRAELADLDQWPVLDAVHLFVEDQRDVVEAVRSAEPAISEAIGAIATRMRLGGRLLYVGAGTGGREAVADAAEIPASYGLRDRVVAIMAGGIAAFVEGRAGSLEDELETGAADLAMLAPTALDVVLGVSASGTTPYVMGAIGAAARSGALTIGFACATGSPLCLGRDLTIEVPTGPEIIAGSTRLKAGTAQKIVLNAISTLVMVQLGRTYGNLMIDVAADNAKLRRRALRVVVQATGVADTRAAAVLDEAGGRAKVAVVALLAGVSTKRAEEVLRAAAGQVRYAVSLADARD